MVNKEKALELIDKVQTSISVLKSTTNRVCGTDLEIDRRFDILEEQLATLQMIVEAEPGSYLNRSYQGL